MSKTDKDNKHVPKHSRSLRCPEKNCNYCYPIKNRSQEKNKALKIENEEVG